jgi:hypothetical protein
MMFELNLSQSRYSGSIPMQVKDLKTFNLKNLTQILCNCHRDRIEGDEAGAVRALCRRYYVPLIICDNNILRYSHVETIWYLNINSDRY